MKKAYRIKKNDEIQQLIQRKQTVGNSYFVLYYIENHDHDHFRYAISVPKKYGIAVKRNLMKRRIREIIKINFFKNWVDFFIVAKTKAADLNFLEIRKILENLFAQAEILRK